VIRKLRLIVVWIGPVRAISLPRVKASSIISLATFLKASADFFNNPAVRWTPDGRAIDYIATRDGISNIWSQPLDGSPPSQVTNFAADRIFHFDWLPASRTVACSRGVVTADVVRFSNLR
jgi:hypothetical protein